MISHNNVPLRLFHSWMCPFFSVRPQLHLQPDSSSFPSKLTLVKYPHAPPLTVSAPCVSRSLTTTPLLHRSLFSTYSNVMLSTSVATPVVVHRSIATLHSPRESRHASRSLVGATSLQRRSIVLLHSIRISASSTSCREGLAISAKKQREIAQSHGSSAVTYLSILHGPTMSNAKDQRSKRPHQRQNGPKEKPKTAAEAQKAQLEKLFVDPSRDVYIPGPPKPKTLPPPREMMPNVQGSSAGAGESVWLATSPGLESH